MASKAFRPIMDHSSQKRSAVVQDKFIVGLFCALRAAFCEMWMRMLNREWLVRPLGIRVAMIPDDVSLIAIFSSLATVS